MTSGRWHDPLLKAARKSFLRALSDRYEREALSRFGDFLNGTSYNSAMVGSGDTPIIRISNITDPASSYLKTNEVFRDRFYVAPGDLLVSWSASFKSILWPGPAGVLNQHIFKVTVHDGVSKSFVRHAIEGSFEEMRTAEVGIGMMHLRRNDILGHEVPRPDTAVQHQVAAFLDWIEAGCDDSDQVPRLPDWLAPVGERLLTLAAALRLGAEASELQAEVIAETAALRQSVYAAAFPVVEDSTVKDYATVQSGYAFKSDWFAESGVKLVRNVNVGHGVLNWNEVVRLPEDRVAEFERFWLREGDIVVSLDRPIISTGIKVARVRKEDLPCLLLQRVGRFVINDDELSAEFLFHWLNSPSFVSELDPGRSNGVPHISQKQIEALAFHAPSSEEQRVLVSKLDEFEGTFAELLATQREVDQELQAMVNALAFSNGATEV